MPRVATKLTPTADGVWKARKRIPEDVGQLPSDNPVFLAYAARVAEGLRKAGLPE
jgi:hypothetical protein